MSIHKISIRPFPGLVNFSPAVVYLFCLNLPAAFSQPGNGLTEISCSSAPLGLVYCVNTQICITQAGRHPSPLARMRVPQTFPTANDQETIAAPSRPSVRPSSRAATETTV